MNIDILQNFKKSDYFSEPFPHLIIEDALPLKVYEKLEDEYQIVINYLKQNQSFLESNKRLQITTKELNLINDFKNTLWLKFAKFHTSKDFFLKLVSIFENEFSYLYPSLFKRIKENKLRTDFVTLRSFEVKDNKNSFIVSDCQPGINTPVHNTSSVRGPHVDNPVEIFGGLYYLKNEKDKAGGDLEIYSINRKPYFRGKAEVDNTNDLSLHSKIKYKKNVFVMFLNSSFSIHGITKREKTNYTRNLTNIIFETYSQDKLFQLNRKNSYLKKIYQKFFG